MLASSSSAHTCRGTLSNVFEKRVQPVRGMIDPARLSSIKPRVLWPPPSFPSCGQPHAGKRGFVQDMYTVKTAHGLSQRRTSHPGLLACPGVGIPAGGFVCRRVWLNRGKAASMSRVTMAVVIGEPRTRTSLSAVCARWQRALPPTTATCIAETRVTCPPLHACCVNSPLNGRGFS
jgi:hypothetical protein